MVERNIHPFDKPNNWTSLTNAYDWLGYDLRHVPGALRTIRKDRGEGADFSSERMLCLGAGQADQELAVANQLGIPHENVVLLDLHFSEAANDRIALEAPSSTRVEQGLFSYLQKPDGVRFSIVTTFGLFDVLNGEHLDEFLRLAPNVLSDNALVFAFSQEVDLGVHGDKGPKEERIIKLASEHGLLRLGVGNFPYEFKFNRSQQEPEEPNS